MAILELKLWYQLSWSSFSIGSLQPKRAATAPQHCSLVHKKNNNKCESIYYLVWHTSSMAEMRYLVCWLRYPTRRSSCFSISPILWLGGQDRRQSNPVLWIRNELSGSSSEFSEFRIQIQAKVIQPLLFKYIWKIKTKPP